MDRRRKDHAVTPLKSKSGEQNASHQWASVRKESISYPLVGGRRGKTNLCWWGCLKMTHWAWHTHTPSYRSACIASSLSCPPSSIPSLYLLTSFCRSFFLPGDEVMPPRPALPLCSPRSHACYYQKPLTLGTKELRRHAASFIRNELSLTLVARGDLLLSLRWHEKQGSGGGQALTFLQAARFTFFSFEILGQWDSAIEGVLNPW